MPAEHRVLNSPTGQHERVQQRRAQALDMRVGGMSYRQIANRLSVSRQTAFKDVQAELGQLDTTKKKSAERLRDIELERCDRLILGLWPQATPQIAKHPQTGAPMMDERGQPIVTTPDVTAVNAVIRAMERRARLLGIDAPVRQEHTGLDGGPVEVMQRASEELSDRMTRLFARMETVHGDPHLGHAGGNGNGNGNGNGDRTHS